MSRQYWGLLLTGALVACGPPPHHYHVRRTALVPVPVPDQVAGPPDDTAEITLSHATVLWAEAPVRPPAANVGLYVPRHQPGLMVRWRPRPPRARGALELDLRAGYEVALVAQSYRIADNGLAPASNGLAFAYWGGWGFSQRFENGFRWSLSSDVMIADVASRIRLECLDCVGPGVTEGEVREGIIGARSQLAVGVRRGPVEVAALGALRNHPLNVGTRNEEIYNDGEAGSTMTSGDVFPVLGVVAGLRPHSRARIATSLFWPIDPRRRTVQYGPIAGASVTISFSRKE